MKTSTVIGIVVVLLVLIGGLFFVGQKRATAPQTPPVATSTTPVTATPDSHTVTSPSGVSFTYAEPYGLATDPAQILVKSYIPPCDSAFEYCLYRTGSTYAATNFESAGLAINKRPTLTSKQACLTTQPDGYTNLKVTTQDGAGYSTSAIGPVSDAATGHYAAGSVYRLWFGTTCYEFASRVGETQFANYPAGTKTEFTAQNRASVFAELRTLLTSVKIAGTAVTFPN